MPISFEIPEFIQQQGQMVKWMADTTMRPYARELDENEHQRPKEFIEQMWPILRDQQKATLDKLQRTEAAGEQGEKKPKPRDNRSGLTPMR